MEREGFAAPESGVDRQAVQRPERLLGDGEQVIHLLGREVLQPPLG